MRAKIDRFSVFGFRFSGSARRFLLFISCFLLLASSAYAAPVAKLIDVKGKVQRRASDSIKWEKAVRNMGLYEGDRIRTLKKGSAVISYGKGTKVNVSKNSLVVIGGFKENDGYEAMDMGIAEGKLTAEADSKITDNEIIFRISGPFAIVEIDSSKIETGKGSLSIALDSSKNMEVKVDEGKASVQYKGEQIVLLSGESAIFKPIGREGRKAFFLDFGDVGKACIIFLGLFAIAAAGIYMKFGQKRLKK